MEIRRRWLPAILTAVVVVVGWGAAFAGPKGNNKINPALITLHAETGQAVQFSRAPFAPGGSLTRVRGGHVLIDAVADGDVSALQTALSSLGMKDIAVFGRIISGHLPISAIPALDAIATLRFAQPSVAARNVGAVTSQGDQAMRADIARATLGVTGAGVKVGVLSDSFNCLGGAANDVVSGDLSTVQVIQEIFSCSGAIDEGRAMLQIVHDVAPGAPLAFASGFNGQAHFANNILALKASGARVIVDDVSLGLTPMFQDGIVAQAVDAVVRQGAAYFSSAGNFARQSYESVFRPGAVFALDQFQAPGLPDSSAAQPTTLPRRDRPITFRELPCPQEARSQSVSSGTHHSSRLVGPGRLMISTSTFLMQLELRSCSALLRTVLAETPSSSWGSRNDGPTVDINLMIVSFAGILPSFIKYIQFGSPNVTIQEFNTASSTVFGHANASGAAAVGAAFIAETPAFGVDPPLLEWFSSSGGTPIFFDTAGNRLASPAVRRKPQIVAPDGVSTTLASTSLNPFFGTSAAAPHAAAVTALMLEKSPVLTPVTVYAALEKTAINMGPPGFDFDTGFGLIQADGAVSLVTTLQAEAAAILPSSRSVQVGTTATAFATVINAGPTTAVDVGISMATPLLGTFSYQITDPATNAPIGAPNVPTNILPGDFQTYVIAITPSGTFSPTDVQFYFAGANTFPVAPNTGLNTLLLSSTPDAGT